MRTMPPQNPFGDTEGTLVEASVPLIAIPVLPAGLELWQGGRSVLPDSCLCLGSCPQEIEANAGVILFVDQISDGEATLKLLQELDALRIPTNVEAFADACQADAHGRGNSAQSYPAGSLLTRYALAAHNVNLQDLETSFPEGKARGREARRRRLAAIKEVRTIWRDTNPS